MKHLKRHFTLITLIIWLISLVFIIVSSINNELLKKPYSSFIEDLNQNRISSVVFNSSENIIVTLNDDEQYVTDNPNTDTLRETLLLKNIDLKDEIPNTLGYTINKTIFILASLGLLSIVIIEIKERGLGNSSIELNDYSKNTQTILSFDDVAGNEEAKESLSDIVDFLRNPDKYKKYGARMPKGVILYGEPGNGKTLFAKAIAGEAKVPFFALSGSDFVQMYVGVGAARIRKLFKKAKSHGKAVIFIDEIDAIGKSRSNNKNESSNGERDQTLNALLTEMSGFSTNEGIVIIAATNRLDILDKALLRPGRFDRHIEISLPDILAREKILKLHLENKPQKNIDLKRLAKKTVYFSGAKLESLINESAILAAKENSTYITDDHIDRAYSIILAGYEKKERHHLNLDEKTLTSYHEAGHALISMILIPEEQISKITIIPTTRGSGGYTLSIPEDNNYHRIDYLKNKIRILLAGRASEELIFGRNKISTGAQSDISRSTDIVLKIICEYGMSKTLGMINLSTLGTLGNAYGNEIITECKEFTNNLYKETVDILAKNKIYLDKLANNLLEKEVLHEDDINIIRKDITNEIPH